MRPVAIVGFAHSELDASTPLDEVELTQAVCSEVRAQVGLEQPPIGVTVSGSSDLSAALLLCLGARRGWSLPSHPGESRRDGRSVRLV